MRPGDLAPDDSDLRSSNFSLAPVNICDALAKVESRSLLVIDTLDLDERGVGVGVALSALVRKVLAPMRLQSALNLCRYPSCCSLRTCSNLHRPTPEHG